MYGIGHKHLTKNKNHNIKSILRKEFLKKRIELPEEEFIKRNENILRQIKKELDLSDSDFIHIFLPIEKFKEINTLPIIDFIKSQGKQLVISKSNLEANEMQHFIFDESTKLVANKWGILEPEGGIKVSEAQLDMVFVPLLAFDKKGNRVGYGKGYYDKFLSKCREDSIKIGLSLFPPLDFISDTEPMDIPLNYCVCPEEFFKF